MKQLHAVVRGDVQMVGFRYFVVQRAEALGLTGWVRNADDGRTVEVVAEGDEASLRELQALLRTGPALSRVEAVDSEWTDAIEHHAGFAVRR